MSDAPILASGSEERAHYGHELERWAEWARQLLGLGVVYKDVRQVIQWERPRQLRQHLAPVCMEGKACGGPACHEECQRQPRLWGAAGGGPFIYTCWRNVREYRAPVDDGREVYGVWMLGPVRGADGRRPEHVDAEAWAALAADFPPGSAEIAAMLARHASLLLPERERALRHVRQRVRHPAASKAAGIVRAECSAALRAQDVARRVGLSPSHFATLFRAETGTTFSAYLAEQLMERAVRLLQRTELPLRAIADRLGYSTPSYFARAFKRHFGTTPSAYRAGLLAKAEA